MMRAEWICVRLHGRSSAAFASSTPMLRAPARGHHQQRAVAHLEQQAHLGGVGVRVGHEHLRGLAGLDHGGGGRVLVEREERVGVLVVAHDRLDQRAVGA